MEQIETKKKKAQPTAQQQPAQHPITVLYQRFQQATAEGRAAAFHYENGAVRKFWIGKQPKRRRGQCGAVTRQGAPCRARVLRGKRRCRMHGGLSTGPKTAEGRVRISESNRRRAATRAANRAELLRRGALMLEEIERRQREGLPIVQ